MKQWVMLTGFSEMLQSLPLSDADQRSQAYNVLALSKYWQILHQIFFNDIMDFSG